MYILPNADFPSTQEDMRIFAIVTGSSAWLRSLAFGHAAIGDAQINFPLYQGSMANLNYQRYVCDVYSCLSHIKELKAFLDFRNETERDEREVFRCTAANIGMVMTYLNENSGCQRQYKRSIDDYRQLLEILVDAIKQLHPKGTAKDSKSGEDWPWYMDVSIHSIFVIAK